MFPLINQGRDSTIEPAYLAEKKEVAPEPNLIELDVTPTNEAQTITPESPVDGYSQVSVSAVTSAIDQNIVAGNIKKDVEILGVTGSYEGSGAETFAVTLTIIGASDSITADKTYSEIMAAINADSKVVFTMTSGEQTVIAPGYYVFINENDTSEKFILVPMYSGYDAPEKAVTVFARINSNNEILVMPMQQTPIG